MTTEQAINLLEEATANISWNRATHLEIIKALQILRAATKPIEND